MHSDALELQTHLVVDVSHAAKRPRSGRCSHCDPAARIGRRGYRPGACGEVNPCRTKRPQHRWLLGRYSRHRSRIGRLRGLWLRLHLPRSPRGSRRRCPAPWMARRPTPHRLLLVEARRSGLRTRPRRPARIRWRSRTSGPPIDTRHRHSRGALQRRRPDRPTKAGARRPSAESAAEVTLRVAERLEARSVAASGMGRTRGKPE